MNRSLKKIQTVLDSVQGVEGGLKFDPSTGGFVAGGSIIQEIDFPFVKNPEPVTQDAVTVTPARASKGENLAVKLEDDDVCLVGNQLSHSSVLISSSKGELKKNKAFSVSVNSKSIAMDDRLCRQTKAQDCPEQTILGSVLGKEGDKWGMGKSSLGVEDCSHDIAYHSPSSLIADEMETGVDWVDRAVEHNSPSSSSMTDSSNGSGSIMHHSSSGSQSFDNQKHSKVKSPCVDSGSKLIVKATYKEDTIRFKFDPSAGCFQLYEEVGARFKLQNGSFQLKYLDDEDEWVMMVNDSDLQECIEILDDLGTRTVKFLVRDMPSGLSSRGSNSCFLADSS